MAPTKQWTSRSIGSRWQHQFFYLMIRFGGRGAAYAVLYPIVLYYVLFRPSVRARSSHYLARRFPKKGALSLLLDSYRLTLEIGKVLVDTAVLGIVGPGVFKISLKGREELQALLAEGRGLVLVTAHVGCWQVAMSSLLSLDAPISVLMHRDPGDIDRQYYEHREESTPFTMIDPAGYLGGTLEMLQRLKAGELVCIMGDRAMGGENSVVTADFLGSAVRFPFSPYKLASATGAPVAVIFPYKGSDGGYALQVAKVMRVPEGVGRSPQGYQPYVRQFAESLEAFVNARPYQFFNFFNMWED